MALIKRAYRARGSVVFLSGARRVGFLKMIQKPHPHKLPRSGSLQKASKGCNYGGAPPAGWRAPRALLRQELPARDRAELFAQRLELRRRPAKEGQPASWQVFRCFGFLNLSDSRSADLNHHKVPQGAGII